MIVYLVMALTNKQQIFINEYVKCWNATEAAKRAGYSPNGNSHRQIGTENLSKPVIQEAIQIKLKESSMSADEVLQRLARFARGNIKNVADISSSIDLTALDDDVSLTIKKFKRRITHNKNGDMHEDVELELYSAHDALRDIGKHHALFTEKLQLSGDEDKPIVVKIVKGVSMDDL